MSGRTGDKRGARSDADAQAARARLAAVGSIASLVSHRARNRLSTIRAALELLNAGLDRNLSPEYRAALLTEMDALLGEFNLGIEMVRCEFGRPERLRARAVVEDAIADFAANWGGAAKAIETDFGDFEPGIHADRRLMRQVLLNLLRNATKAAEGRQAPRVRVRSSMHGSLWALEVDDNGPGVDPLVDERLFVDGISSWGGTGLGLLLCRDAMTVMGGSIRHSGTGDLGGARFTVTLPVAP